MSQVLGKERDETLDSPLPIPPLDSPMDALQILKPTEPKYAIWIAEDCVIYTRDDRPNIIRRFFLWLFFGWRYTKVKK